MSKYEIMLLIDGDLSEVDARVKAQPLLSLFENLSGFELAVVPSSPLAYQIKKKSTAHRFILNFELEDKSVLVKFKDACVLNKFLLRHLVINIEKDYGYKSSINPKKIKFAATQKVKYQKYIEIKNLKNQQKLAQ